jgi:hypothetical protein
MATLKNAPDLYTTPPIAAIPGARVIRRSVPVTTDDLALTTQFIGAAVLPAGHRLMDAKLEVPDSLAASGLTISIGILNTYYNQPAASAAVPAAYNSGGVTNTGTTPALVSGQNVFTSDTIGQAGGRSNPTLAFTAAIGVDYEKDRVIAFYFPVAATTPVAGNVDLIFKIDAA